jgi:hypothetical protein
MVANVATGASSNPASSAGREMVMAKVYPRASL